MRQDAKLDRQQQIEKATYDLLEQGGYAAATMQAVAKRAGASMETLYRWYGDKLGLFRSLVERNAGEVREMLQLSLQEGDDPLEALQRLGPRLLALLTGERAIALNKAAAADNSGELGAALAASGRGTVAPLVAALLQRADDQNHLAFEDATQASEIYLGLLIGDLQIRRLTGQLGPLTEDELTMRGDRALGLTERIFSP